MGLGKRLFKIEKKDLNKSWLNESVIIVATDAKKSVSIQSSMSKEKGKDENRLEADFDWELHLHLSFFQLGLP